MTVDGWFQIFILVARSLDPNRPHVMQEAAKLLGAICILHDLQGHERVLEAITIAGENQSRERFSPIVQGVLAKSKENDSTRVSIMRLVH
jgi:diaphanous 1